MMFNGFILGAKVGIFLETNKFFELFLWFFFGDYQKCRIFAAELVRYQRD